MSARAIVYTGTYTCTCIHLSEEKFLLELAFSFCTSVSLFTGGGAEKEVLFWLWSVWTVLCLVLEHEMKVRKVRGFYRPPLEPGSSRHRLSSRSSSYQLCGRLSRGSLRFSPGAEGGSREYSLEIKGSFPSPSSSRNLSLLLRLGMARQHPTVLVCVYLNILRHSCSLWRTWCLPRDAVPQNPSLLPHPCGTCCSSGKKRRKRRAPFRVDPCCPNLFDIQCGYRTSRPPKHPAAWH